MSIVGFTGTRQGMSRLQRRSLISVLAAIGMTAAHHGDCLGADAQFATIANAALRPHMVVVHPPVETRHRARAIVPHNVVREAKGYHERDRDIVEETEILIACPLSGIEVGGTWYTANHARKLKRPVVFVWPDGRVTFERCDPGLATALEDFPTA